MGYISTFLNQEIIIDHLVTVHYFEYTSDFFFPGEVHNFWEFLYVDKGEVEVTAGETCYLLKKGDVIFHKPMEFHNLWANGVIAPNLVVVAFECISPAMQFFEDKILRAGDAERDLLAKIVEEANQTFSSALDDPNLRSLERSGDGQFGSEQIIKLSLELMLLQLIRKGDVPQTNIRITSSIREKEGQDVFARIQHYLEDNIHNRITLDDVCRDNLFGRSYLQKIFREKTGGGVMDYFGKMKISAAKQAIREGTRNFTGIANELGYTSIHYFSRHFKKVTGMTPSEYASSVKIRSESTQKRPVSLKK
ncbi:AraC family transcriptional regulator [Hydrogenoanaerobacterium sp.]|uniref:AraC family transcriptional regulator n=1 Tax=Hydrogenoanaerobacterium sp. TaxID=2953763 RepID=UPI0028A2AC71|nr:AraC family transcriptional regulator [Hydrogenoanaerobacterium sp.]